MNMALLSIKSPLQRRTFTSSSQELFSPRAIYLYSIEHLTPRGKGTTEKLVQDKLVILVRSDSTGLENWADMINRASSYA